VIFFRSRIDSEAAKEPKMPKEIVTSSKAPTTGFTDKAKAPPIVQAIKAGPFLYVSGQGPLDPDTKEVVHGDIEAQTRRTMQNLVAVLEAGGATLANVVNMRVCLRHVEDFARFNETFREMMAGEKTTRTCIGGTPHRKGVNVEIDCVAYLG
jgi:2-iminobutanoate/2-iminopropanoate deaminase